MKYKIPNQYYIFFKKKPILLQLNGCRFYLKKKVWGSKYALVPKNTKPLQFLQLFECYLK